MTSSTNRYPHACDEMKLHLDDGEVGIRYADTTREYSIVYPEKPGSVQLIHFCPWCGAKLPEPLRDRWADELEELGVDDPVFGDQEKLPVEFRSDEWWRKRGL